MAPGPNRVGFWLLTGWLILFLAPQVNAEPEVMRVRYPDMSGERDRRNAYFVDLLRLALEKTRPEFGPYQLEPVDMRIPQGRILRMLSTGRKVDLLWSMTSHSREKHLRAVRIPLTRGVSGYRLLIIRAEDRDEFAAIRSVEQLAGKVAGQGEDWPDTDILRHNGLTVTTSGYHSLFTMLRRGRIDYIPRALNEPWIEVAQRPELNLAVEPRLMLYYPAANYFFVRRGNHALARRLEAGLELALKDGSFRSLFREHPQHQAMFSESQTEQRRMLRLENPLLPKSAPLGRDSLWWSPGTLAESEAP